MMRQVLVLWDDEPIAVWACEASRAIRVGSDANADVVLPLEPAAVDSDGDHPFGRFLLRVTSTEETWRRAPFCSGGGLRYAIASLLVHAALGASLLVAARLSPEDPGADEASRLAAMKGYVARASDRGNGVRASSMPTRVARVEASEAAPERSANADAPVASPLAASPTRASTRDSAASRRSRRSPDPAAAAHADTGSDGRGTSGARGDLAGASFRAGDDWSGSYVCVQGRTDLVFHIVASKDDSVSAVFDFTHAPTGVHGAYRMHGRIDPISGEATLTPDEWIEQPPRYVSVGMTGRFAGSSFNGTITHSGCGGFSLHRGAATTRG
jgi:hypothetical protein